MANRSNGLAQTLRASTHHLPKNISTPKISRASIIKNHSIHPTNLAQSLHNSAIMHFVRRAALRAASSPSASLISKSRSITTTTSPFAARTKAQASIAQSIPRRFFSDEKSGRELGEVAESGRGAFGSASESATGFAPRRPFNGERRGGFSDRGNFNDRGVDRRGPPRDRPLEVKPAPTIYIGNLLFDVAATDLEREFAQFGTVTRALIATDDRGLSKGFGYVYFETVEAATAAIQAKHQAVFEGRRIVVNYMLESTKARSTNVPSKTLFIGNIPFEMSDADLNKLFRDITDVVDVRVAIDRRTGQPRGFAHADFRNVEAAIAGKEALVGKELYGRTLRVDYSANAREPRERREETPVQEE